MPPTREPERHGFASLQNICHKVVCGAGIRRVTGTVLIDISLFTEGYRELGTGTTISPVAVNDNQIDLHVKAGARSTEDRVKAHRTHRSQRCGPMAVIFALVELGRTLGFPAQNREKAEYAHKQAIVGLESMRRAGVKIGFGTDLLGETYMQQCREFTIRNEVFSPLEILRQATSNNASLLMQTGKLGCIAPAAHADLLVVEGDPLKDIGLLAASGKHLRLIMRAGEFIRNELG